VAYNPQILNAALRARSLSKDALSQRLSIGVGELEGELSREPEPSQSFLNDVARELALPSFVFFMERLPPLNDVIVDFRSDVPGPAPRSRAATESLQFASAVQRLAVAAVAEGTSGLPTFGVTTVAAIDKFADQVRADFGPSIDAQIEAADARTFYTLCRYAIEARGVFVLHDSFPDTDGSGYCLAHDKHPVIVINTFKQNRGRQLFTLVHELGHVLMHKTGVSDPFVRKNAIEQRCNRFAGSFLLPKEKIGTLLRGLSVPSDPDLDDVKRVARRLKVSQQAAVLRLEEAGVFKTGSYAKWIAAVRAANPDFVKEGGGGGGGPPPQEKVKLAKYGFRFASAFDAPVRRGQITDIALYRASGLKPKFRASYFSYAQSLTPQELPSLELDDE